VHPTNAIGTIRMELSDVKRIDSGIVTLTYRPVASGG
jgi:hypothetical protein